MQSEEHRDQTDSDPPRDEAPRPRPIVKVTERTDRLSGDHIHLSPRAQRRMAMGRRSGI